MLILGLFLVSKLAGSAATAVRAVSGPQLGGGNVSWQSTCEPFVTDYDNNTHPATECGLFQVPRDYANSSAGTFTIAVARRNATVGPRLGTIFVNPGGPGLSGVQNVWDDGDLYLNFTGAQYDIVSWDPRGAGQLWGLSDCLGGGTYHTNDTLLTNSGPEAFGNFTNANNTDPDELALWQKLNATDADLRGISALCLQTNGANLTYIGTPAVVRDMISLSDSIEGANKTINYWGISYGTIVGSYFINMFPERVGRVILDGIVNPIKWAAEPQYQLWGYQIQDAPKVYDGFIHAWAQSGELPSGVSSSNHTEADLKAWVSALMDTAFTRHASDADSESSAVFRGHIFGDLYGPPDWPGGVSDLLVTYATLHRNGTTPSSLSAELSTSAHSPYVPARWRSRLPSLSPQKLGKRANTIGAFSPTSIAVACGDSVDAANTTTRDVFNEIVFAATNVSQLIGPVWDFSYYCHVWPARAVERYSGPWNATLPSPILLIGNTADNITPLVSAKTVADMLGSSAVLLERDGYGHSSWAENSTCTNAVVAAYFTNGTLPIPGTVCATEENPFGLPSVSNDSSSSTVLSTSASTAFLSISTSL